MDPILLAERVVKAFTTRNELEPFLDDKEQLAEDLHNLSEWIAKDGFIPFVEVESNKKDKVKMETKNILVKLKIEFPTHLDPTLENILEHICYYIDNENSELITVKDVRTKV